MSFDVRPVADAILSAYDAPKYINHASLWETEHGLLVAQWWPRWWGKDRRRLELFDLRTLNEAHTFLRGITDRVGEDRWAAVRHTQVTDATDWLTEKTYAPWLTPVEYYQLRGRQHALAVLPLVGQHAVIHLFGHHGGRHPTIDLVVLPSEEGDRLDEVLDGAPLPCDPSSLLAPFVVPRLTHYDYDDGKAEDYTPKQ